ncbi:MAG: hypothetical protein JWQ09_3741 [Segetibacter sp.]|nr:hypothetical protein [Segetibacter sp.]
MDEFYKSPISAGAEKYFAKVKDLIHYCEYDQSYDGADVIWLMGEQAELGEVLADYRVPDKYIDEVASHMKCRGCGHNDFNRYSDVGLIDPIDKQIQEKIKQANKKYKKRIDDLLDFIEKFPSLVLKNPIAKKIYREISEGKVPTCTLQNAESFRCRLPDGSRGFTFEEIHAPKVGIAQAGRYNHSGQSVLYLSRYLETAITEVSGVSKGKVDIWHQQYRIERMEPILDLSIDWEGTLKLSILFTAVVDTRILKRTSSDSLSTWKPEYLLTTFIADCAKSCGYKGIKYPAIKGYGDNYVIFDPLDKSIQPVGAHTRIQFDFRKDSDIVDF